MDISGFRSTIGASRRRFALILLASFLVCSLLLRLAFWADFVDDVAFSGGSDGSLFSSERRKTIAMAATTTSVSGLHRKLVSLTHAPSGSAMKQLNRVPGDRCSYSDIVINQGATTQLLKGIPIYSVEIQNQCVGAGCAISRIHLSCGWFSSATMINPLVFKRLAYNDCLVNDGKPLACGATLSFQYASTFIYPFSVSSFLC